jgi:hypothetical protein
MSVESLTFVALRTRLTISPEAARLLARRLRCRTRLPMMAKLW